MGNLNDFEVPAEFGGKTDEELLQEFLDECPVTEDSYVSVYGVLNVLPPSISKFAGRIPVAPVSPRL